MGHVYSKNHRNCAHTQESLLALRAESGFEPRSGSCSRLSPLHNTASLIQVKRSDRKRLRCVSRSPRCKKDGLKGWQALTGSGKGRLKKFKPDASTSPSHRLRSPSSQKGGGRTPGRRVLPWLSGAGLSGEGGAATFLLSGVPSSC